MLPLVLLVLIFEIVWHLSGKVLPGVTSSRLPVHDGVSSPVQRAKGMRNCSCIAEIVGNYDGTQAEMWQMECQQTEPTLP